MRPARLGLALTAVVAGLIAPSSASAQTNSVSVGSVTLDPAGGTSLTVRLDVVCEPTWNIATAQVFVEQNRKDGGFAPGVGNISADYPGVPCTGSTQPFFVTVPSSRPATPLRARQGCGQRGRQPVPRRFPAARSL